MRCILVVEYLALLVEAVRSGYRSIPSAGSWSGPDFITFLRHHIAQIETLFLRDLSMVKAKMPSRFKFG